MGTFHPAKAAFVLGEAVVEDSTRLLVGIYRLGSSYG
jgi:hypothetical protein